MPEGPSIVILIEELQKFNGKKVRVAGGNAKIDLARLNGKTIRAIRSHGKQFFICFDGFYLRFHLMMFGSYRIDEDREGMSPRLSLRFANGRCNFYSCSVRLLEGGEEDLPDPVTDTMSEAWDPHRALTAMMLQQQEMICDVLLDQDIFAGVGNIIKNEVLWLVKVHPETLAKNIPEKKAKEIVKTAREYCFDFYRWKKQFVLRKHWQVYRRPLCPRCDLKIKIEWLGKRDRKSFFCENCQPLLKIKKKPAKKASRKRPAKKLSKR